MSTVDVVEWLCSGASAACRHSADEAVRRHPGDPLGAAADLRRRHPEARPEQAAAVLEQAHLRAIAQERYDLDATDLLLTRDGLEQATRPAVARRRADLIQASGARRVLDLTAGLGFDTRAFLAAGLDVISVERDPATAALLSQNAPGAHVVVADATDPQVLAPLLERLDPTDVVFVDPARRDPAGPRAVASGRSRPERDPERWSPPWSFVATIPHPRVAAKVAPSFRPPSGWQAEWTSLHRTVVECGLYSWHALEADRQAALVTPDGVTVVAGSADPPSVAPAIGAWVHEPDPALLRAQALPSLLGRMPGTGLVDPASTWLTGDAPPAEPLGLRSYRVVVDITGSRKQQRRQLADRGITRLVVKTRDTDDDPSAVLRSLGVTEGPGHVLVLTRRAGRTITLLVQPSPA